MFYHGLIKAPDSMSVIMCHNDTACVNNLVMSSWCRAVCIGRCPMSHAVATVCIIQGVRAKFDTFCFHYISELLQDIDIG